MHHNVCTRELVTSEELTGRLRKEVLKECAVLLELWVDV
jgi:hypothetical protein